MNPEPTINFDAVPDYVRDDIVKATLEAVKRFLAQPGGKEYLDNKIREKKADSLRERHVIDK